MSAVPIATDGHSVLERISWLAGSDRILRGVLGGDYLWVDGTRFAPSGPDRLACAVTQLVVRRPESALALASPRGAGPLPTLLGLYLALWRKAPASGYGRLVGSVAVSTRRAG